MCTLAMVYALVDPFSRQEPVNLCAPGASRRALRPIHHCASRDADECPEARGVADPKMDSTRIYLGTNFKCGWWFDIPFYSQSEFGMMIPAD